MDSGWKLPNGNSEALIDAKGPTAPRLEISPVDLQGRAMKFNDTIVNTDERFTIGIEEVTGKFYASIPVSNRLVGYDEYYEISEEPYELFLKNSSAARIFVERCRARQEDELLIFQPGADRGIAT